MRSAMNGVLGVCLWVTVLSATAAEDRVDGRGRIIDLSPYYTTRFDAPGYDKAGKQLPSINPVFDGLRFDLRGQVTLWGRTMSERHEYCPVAARGISVGAKFEELHLCHHARWTDVPGNTIGLVRLNYADGSRHEYPIVFGEHVRDWFFLPSYEDETLGDPEAKVIWRDPDEDNNHLRGFRRLWKTRFLNPHPERTVATMDFESTRSFAHYSVVAATIAARDETRQQTPSIPFDQPKRRFTGKIEITVLDQATGKPLPNVVVDPGTFTLRAGVVAEMLITDAKGQATFRYWKEETTRVSLLIRGDGYEPQYKAFRGNIEESVEFRLDRGKTIGGVVVDAAQQPVEGASVTFGRLVACTDPEGRWQLSGVDPRNQSYGIHVGHPGFPTTTFRMGSDVTSTELADGTAKLSIPHGSKLSGTVNDETGKPVAGAKIFFGKSLYDSTKAEAVTGSDGSFLLENLPLGANYVTVSAPGKAPAFASVTVDRKNESLALTLKPGTVVSGQVVDASGHAVKGVRISVNRMQTPRTLEFQFTTAADGRFYWEAAPDETLSFSFSKDDLQRRHQMIQPGQKEELIVIMNALQTVAGVVVDAATGSPIPLFNVAVGQAFGGGQTYFSGIDSIVGKDGRFTTKLNRLSADEDGVVKVEAEGYVPALSVRFPANAPPETLQFRLERGEIPKGIVRQPDGRPAKGAQVALQCQGEQLMLRDGALSSFFGARSAISESAGDGRFHLSLRANPTRIIAAHESGYAEIALEGFKNAGTIQLMPWGRLTATLTKNGKPLPNESMSLTPAIRKAEAVNLQFEKFPLKTDAEGRLTVSKLPPGDYRLVRLVETGDRGQRSWIHLNGVPATVEAGKTASVNLEVGPSFRTVTGQIVVPEKKDGVRGDIEVELICFTPMKPMGQTITGDPARHKLLAEQGYVNPHFKPETDQDGRFQAENVPTGQYSLRATLYGEPIPGTTYRNRLGFTSIPVEVSNATSQTGKALDLGIHEIQFYLKEGDVAPAIEARTTDGRPFKLADYRGRYVLLDFWATWCGPCLRETPNIKAVREEFRDDERLTIVGLNLDHSIDAMRRYVADNELDWMDVYLGPWGSESVTKAFRIRSIPQIMLIGPDGKIVALGLRGDRIRKSIVEALRGGR
jgi:thiol-disulfide isomerase/thioredoxin